MKKVLFLGNNTVDTDIKTRVLAEKDNDHCHGLLSELNNTIPCELKPGYYHSSIYDIEYGQLVELAKKFDQVIMLDQPREQYSHPDAFYKTVQLIQQISNGKFLDPSYATDINFFKNLVETNKSFCIFPFIELLTNQRTDGYTTVCCRSSTPVAHISNIADWKTNKEYLNIRQSMINGKMLPEHCSMCYKLEQKNIQSARQQETVEWANRLGLRSLKDLDDLSYPSYYEIRPSNICNLQCRMCGPDSSHLIAKEYQHLQLITDLPVKKRTAFDIVNFTNLKKLYVAGGEPTAMPEFYNFVDQCIANNKTDFEFVINTNGTKLNKRFKKQLKSFSNFQFTVSIDGFDRLNYYIRWPSCWTSIIENMHYLRNNGHVVSTNVTVSIYNVIHLHELLQFFDNEFPGMLIHCAQCESKDDILSGFKFPYPAVALQHLIPIRQLKCYKNDLLLQSFIDGLIDHYKSATKIDVESLVKFFQFNDMLDNSRSINLKDYVPELARAREFLIKS